MLRILYLGSAYGTSRHRADALQRLGNQVSLVDPWSFFPQGKLSRKVIGKLICELGAGVFEPYIRRRVFRAVGCNSYDLIWVDNGELLGPLTLSRLRDSSLIIINYNIDDPYGKRDRRRFALYRKAVPCYDLIVVVRNVNVGEANAAGARRVLRVFMSADEIAHAPVAITAEEKARWLADVVFVGTWLPERGPLMAQLLELGVPLRIHGDRWQKAREWPVIRQVWAGPGLAGSDYVKAIQGAKICLGLLSKGNRDEHTTRSIEIPYIGSVLCTERSREHLKMYEENKEAVFWSTPEECAAKCQWLLRDEPAREKIARAGKERCKRNGFLNERLISEVIEVGYQPSIGDPKCQKKEGHCWVWDR